MQKNVASQKWTVFAFDETDNTAKAGDAAQITAEISIDGAAGDAVDDTNPTELEDGYYVFDIAQAETNGDYLVMMPESSTGNIQVIGVPGGVWTTEPNRNKLSIDASGRVDIAKWIGTAVTLSTGNNPDVNIDEISDDTTAPGNLELAYDGTGYAGGTVVTQSDLVKIHGSALTETAGQLAAAFVKLFDVGTPTLVASSVMRGTDSAYTGTPPTAAAIVNEWETQSQSDPTGFHVNVKEVNGTAQTAGDIVALINTIDDFLDTEIAAIKAVTDDMKVLDTTISSIDTADTVFRVAAGLTGNDDINNAVCSIYDVTGGIWSGPRRVTDYVHATLQITIDANTAFTLQASDRVVIWNVSYATTAAAGSVTPSDIADITDAVWDETQSDHVTEGTTGEKQNRSDRTGR